MVIGARAAGLMCAMAPDARYRNVLVLDNS